MAKQKQELSMDELLEQALVPEAEQPHEVPGNWVWTKLEQVAKWGSGGTPSRKNPNFYVGDIPWVKTGELNDGYIYDTKEKISAEAIQKSSAKIFPVNTVVIAMYGATIGKVSILGIEATTNQACACAVTNEDMLFKYLFYFLADQKEAFIKKGKGGAQPNISQEIIKQHKIPLPPLAEQQRIVDRIESLFAKLDKAKELVQNALDSFANRKAAILHKAFSGELTANWRIEHGVGMDSWEEKELVEVCNKITDGTHKSPPNSEKGDFMYITAKNIKEHGIDLSTITYISGSDHKEIYSRCNVEEGDVLYIKDGATTGIATINTIKEEISLLSSVALLKVNKNKLFANYLMYNLNSPDTKSMMINNMSGNAITRLTLTKIKMAKIDVPTLPEQKEIVHVLDSLLKKEKKANEMGKLISEIDLMKKIVLARAFRGELGTNDPSEENARTLLKKVLQEKK